MKKVKNKENVQNIYLANDHCLFILKKQHILSIYFVSVTPNIL